MGKNIFNTVETKKLNRNVFDLTHDVKTTLDFGKLVPVMCKEAVPGDKFRLGADSLVRFSPMLAPVMHRFDVTIHYFFVPYRILWENFEEFITGGNGTDPVPAVPYVNMDSGNETDLADYFGIPPYGTVPGATQPEKIVVAPFAAYQMIYNEYYRDQNLSPEIDYQLVDGDNEANAELYQMRRRAWEHDYLTSCLPFAQKGDPVRLPITQFEDLQVLMSNSGGTTLTGAPTNVPVDGVVAPPPIDPDSLYIPGSSINPLAATINELRYAFRLQEWQEKQSRAGSRYIETIKSHFGVMSSDKRLQRPEYITGVKAPIIVSEVLNTTGETGANDSPQGTMSGHAVGVAQGIYGDYFCEEHGYVLGIMSVLPKTAYQQGVERMWKKTVDRFDHFWPEFANIGEQAVYNSEAYAYQADGLDTFGYIPRYAEYRFANNLVTKEFRDSLDFWHAGRIFSAQPGLNQAFIECTTDDRIFAVTGAGVDNIYAQVLNKLQVSRLMPKYGTPYF